MHVQETSGTHDRKRRRLLVAEDDAEMRHMIAGALEADGADVVEADGGEELLHWAQRVGAGPSRHVFDAIISDIQMPDLTAFDVLDRVPLAPRNTPVILITGTHDRTVSDEGYRLGAELVLRKPVDLDDLRAIVRSVVRFAA